ncbi:molecular chaperone TorD family protein [Bacillus sp. B-jedd]|uniref:molecular chaperone TorD family protein n=1 Tax=Bacillus sp. B-jedd TaxID=1476857 RepID=UPI0005155D95|nr:molecular chaperone TorD family protein [Bacillus sp. B-jedd]CEG29249.1 Nitrate reductase delta subunit [Bacillus sp. B-jedd]
MNNIQEEQQGLIAMADLFTAIWMGEWNTYEDFFQSIPVEFHGELPFHGHYNREEADLWLQNHFSIPGEHFISPYYSSYRAPGQDEEVKRNSLLRLIGMYERTGYYFPLEKEIYPDHIAALTGFAASILKEEAKAAEQEDKEYLDQLGKLKRDVVEIYLAPLVSSIKVAAQGKVNNPFVDQFVLSVSEFVEKDLLAEHN